MKYTFTGPCVGGPNDGKFMAHTARIKKFFKPVVAWSMNIEKSPVEAMEIGEYVHLGRRWKWVKK
jgi:hypothetical protein